MLFPAAIHDWNACPNPSSSRRPLFNDETLRDGLQSPSVRDPELSDKRDMIHRLAQIGVEAVDLGMPGAGSKALSAVMALLVEIRDHRLPIRPNVAVRTVEQDLAQAAEVQQRVGIPLEAGVFLGSSAVRMDAESWDIGHLVRLTRNAVSFCRREQVQVMMVTEDTTRASPDALKALYGAALDEGAQALCLADTVGHATPHGAQSLVRLVREEIIGQRRIQLDWHGHNDRGLAVACAMAAWEAGADRLHGTILGIGERCGNASLDQLLVNFTLAGSWKGDLTHLPALAERVAALVGVEIPTNYPILGRDAFRTGTGVHAAAIVKALRRGDARLADLVYSAVPASVVNRRQEIEVGPMAGRSNVEYWLESRGYDVTPERVSHILALAKRSNRVLIEEDIRSALMDL